MDIQHLLQVNCHSYVNLPKDSHGPFSPRCEWRSSRSAAVVPEPNVKLHDSVLIGVGEITNF